MKMIAIILSGLFLSLPFISHASSSNYKCDFMITNNTGNYTLGNPQVIKGQPQNINGQQKNLKVWVNDWPSLPSNNVAAKWTYDLISNSGLKKGTVTFTIIKNDSVPEIAYTADAQASNIINPQCNITWQGDPQSGCTNEVDPNIWVSLKNKEGGCGSDN